MRYKEHIMHNICSGSGDKNFEVYFCCLGVAFKCLCTETPPPPLNLLAQKFMPPLFTSVPPTIKLIMTAP